MRVVLMWLLMIGVIVFWLVFSLWLNHHRMPAEEPSEGAFGTVVSAIGSLMIGGFFLLAGTAAYVLATFTGCFSFNFKRPVWNSVKTRLYFTNIIVTVLLALGLGFSISAFVSPFLVLLGFDKGLACMLPVMFMIGALQIVQLWVLIWSPLEKQIITKRLAAMGISPAQLQSAAFVGLSNPASGFTKRFCAIEEDMGALWVGPEQLIYWGDGEQFGIPREQLLQMERRADNRSTSMLGGIAHIILHVKQSDGSVRQIRLHTEAHLTMGGKRVAMDALAGAISRWHAGSL